MIKVSKYRIHSLVVLVILGGITRHQRGHFLQNHIFDDILGIFLGILLGLFAIKDGCEGVAEGKAIQGEPTNQQKAFYRLARYEIRIGIFMLVFSVFYALFVSSFRVTDCLSFLQVKSTQESRQSGPYFDIRHSVRTPTARVAMPPVAV